MKIKPSISSQDSFAGATALPSDDDVFIEKVIKELLPVIDNNLDDAFLSKKMAKKSGFSKWYFNRNFSRLTGKTVSDYIRERRLLVVAYELIWTNKKIIDISNEQGFSTQQTLSRLFKVRFGTTPTMFRKQARTAVINSFWVIG